MSKKISELTSKTTLAGTDVLPVVSSSDNYKATVNALFTERKFRSTKKVATIGTTEILTADGTFDSSTGWTVGAGWAIGSGKATHTPGSTAALSCATTMENAEVYKCLITISGRTAGSLNILLGTFDLTLTLNQNKECIVYGICSPTTEFNIIPTTDFDGSIEIVQLFKIERSTPEFSMDASSGRPHEFRTGNDGGNLGIGWQALSCVQLDYSYVGALDESGPEGPYRGNNNVGIGNRVLPSVITGKYNVAVGQECMLHLTTGYCNVGMGDSAMNYATSAWRNTAIGYEVMRNATKNTENVAIGALVMNHCHTGNQNTMVGASSGFQLTTGNYNTALGYKTLNAITTSSQNVAIGYLSLQLATTGTQNVCIGAQAGSAMTTGSNNIMIGHSAGRGTSANAPVSDTNMVIIGAASKRSAVSATYMTNYILIGYGAEVEKSHQIVIGNSSNTEFKTYGDFIAGTDDTFWLGAKSNAWKGIRVKDTADGNYYSIVVTSGSLAVVGPL